MIESMQRDLTSPIADEDTLLRVAIGGAALNLTLFGCVKTVAIMVCGDGKARCLAVHGGTAAEVSEVVRAEALRHDASAVALVFEAWTAVVRDDTDLAVRPRDRTDRGEAVRVHLYTRSTDRSWWAPIVCANGVPALGEFRPDEIEIGHWARLLQPRC